MNIHEQTVDQLATLTHITLTLQSLAEMVDRQTTEAPLPKQSVLRHHKVVHVLEEIRAHLQSILLSRSTSTIYDQPNLLKG